MRVPIFMVDIFTIAFMDPTFAFHKTPRFISSCTALFNFLSAVVITVLFLIVSLIRHQLIKFLQF